LLRAMIRQRLARDLPSGNTATIGENCQHEHVHSGPLLKTVEHLFDALIDE
jgi:hypothetical protein